MEAFVQRRAQLLRAAETCFAKAGFHRTTMQSIATDAGMSVGNVYRYFPSKDAVVEALVDRDQARMAHDFDSLSTDDLMGAFASLMRRQIVESGRAKSVMWLEICAEAARNPTIAGISRAHERAIATHLTSFFTRVMADRAAAHRVTLTDPAALARLTVTLFTGLMVTQALAPEGSIEAGVDQLLATVLAAVEGHIALEPAPMRIDA